MSSFYTRRLVIMSAALAVLGGCATHPGPVSIADTLATTPQLSTLASLVNKAGLTETLKSGGPFTVFAPGNDAFAKVSAKTMGDLAQNPDKLKAVLTYHVVPGKAMAGDVKNASAKTVNGASLALSKAGEFVTVEDAVVQKADIAATNGVIHIIDSVLIPAAK